VPIPRLALAAVYVVGIAIAEGLRLPQRLRRARSAEAWSQPEGGRGLGESLVLAAVLVGIWVLPAVFILTSWLGALDYSLPGWTAWPAVIVFALGLLLRLRAQVDLGRAWSPTVELGPSHHLVTEGIYARIRHPLYASLILWAIAQPVLLQNLIAGWMGPLAVALIWLVRVPAEERMMRVRFGEEYVQYARQTGRVIPRPRKQAA
jgi:protein-S-isoprenylcysteine O-methyltransferase Ste14